LSFSYTPGTVLRQWGPDSAFTVRDSTRNVIIFGGTDSGKTSGPAKHLLRAYLAAHYGGLCLTVKPDEARYLYEQCRDAGRGKEAIIVRPGTGARYNFLESEVARAGGGAGLTINIVKMLDEVIGAIVAETTGETDSGGDTQFFRDALRHLLMNLVDACLLSGRPVSLPLMRLIINSAALSRQEAKNPDWRASSSCGRVLSEAEERCADADEDTKASLAETLHYFLVEYPALSDRTRSIINLSFSMLARPLLTPPMRELLSTDTTITPEACFDGRIIIVDLPVQEYGTAGKIAQLAWKYCYQTAMLRRAQAQSGTLRPCFLYVDECQHFITPFDAIFHSTSRSSGNASIFITQSREGLRLALGSDAGMDAFLANCQCKIFTQSSSIETNAYASRLIGARYVDVESMGSSQSYGGPEETGKMGGSTNTQPQLRNYVEEAEFAQLLKGGPPDFRVSAIAYKAGETFLQGGERVPYIRLTFNQRK
jgi:TraM recognition site of TraD and TraG